MPRISSSRDDTVVEQTVPSTIVDPSSGTGLLLRRVVLMQIKSLMHQAIVVKPSRKFGIKGPALRRAPS